MKPQPPATKPRTLTIDLMGHDRPGIIQAIAHALAKDRGALVLVPEIALATPRRPESAQGSY